MHTDSVDDVYCGRQDEFRIGHANFNVKFQKFLYFGPSIHCINENNKFHESELKYGGIYMNRICVREWDIGESYDEYDSLQDERMHYKCLLCLNANDLKYYDDSIAELKKQFKENGEDSMIDESEEIENVNNGSECNDSKDA